VHKLNPRSRLAGPALIGARVRKQVRSVMTRMMLALLSPVPPLIVRFTIPTSYCYYYVMRTYMLLLSGAPQLARTQVNGSFLRTNFSFSCHNLKISHCHDRPINATFAKKDVSSRIFQSSCSGPISNRVYKKMALHSSLVVTQVSVK
jgi:hypothetical protein